MPPKKGRAGTYTKKETERVPGLASDKPKKTSTQSRKRKAEIVLASSLDNTKRKEIILRRGALERDSTAPEGLKELKKDSFTSRGWRLWKKEIIIGGGKRATKNRGVAAGDTEITSP